MKSIKVVTTCSTSFLFRFRQLLLDNEEDIDDDQSFLGRFAYGIPPGKRPVSNILSGAVDALVTHRRCGTRNNMALRNVTRGICILND